MVKFHTHATLPMERVATKFGGDPMAGEKLSPDSKYPRVWTGVEAAAARERRVSPGTGLAL